MAFDYAAKIQALLANADNESLSDEARQAYRAKAEELMIKYRIAEEEALATDPGSAMPIFKEIVVASELSILEYWYRVVFTRIVEHAGCRTTWTRKRDGKGHMNWVGIVCGYDGDVRYADYLWTAALLMFSTRIDPVWDDTLPEAENVWRLRNAGIERKKIADRAWGYGAGREAKNRSRVQRIYLRECANRGEPAKAAGLGHQTDVYREAYAREFVYTLQWRLQKARDAANSTGGGVVLHGRNDRVDEAFYGRFPSLRPTPVDPNAEPYVPEPCAACEKARDGACRKHRLTQADIRRQNRMYNSPSARAGASRGDAAARDVHLGRDETAQANRVGRKVREITD